MAPMLRATVILKNILLFEYLIRCCNNLSTEDFATMSAYNESNIEMNPFHKSFDYKEQSIDDLSKIKAPYINHGRDIFVTSEVDIQYLVLKDLEVTNQLIQDLNLINSRILIVADSLINLLNNRRKKNKLALSNNERQYQEDNLVGVALDKKPIQDLNDALIQISSLLRKIITPTKEIIISFIRAADIYVFEDLKVNLFILQLKPSVILHNEFDNNNLTRVRVARWLKILSTFMELSKSFIKNS